MLKFKGVQRVDHFFKEKGSISHIRNVANFELKLTNVFAHHNVPFQFIEHLLPVLKSSLPDSNILKDSKLGRTKTTNIIKNVLAEYEVQNLSKTLQQTFFSVLLDESTDISLNKLLCINVKFVDNNGKINDKLLELLTIDSKCANAENLFGAFKNCMHSKNIPLKNIIGLACDNASVMLGKHNSFMTRLQAETDALVVLPCICHSAAIVASNACSKLPRTPEEFVRNLASYFSHSSKRTAELANMQAFFHDEQKKND